MNNGCSIRFFCDSVNTLEKLHGDKYADQESFDEMTNLLGQVEKLYQKLDDIEK